MITPQSLAERAAKALVTVDAVLKRADVRASTVWRWKKGLNEPRLLTQQKIIEALEAFEREKVA